MTINFVLFTIYDNINTMLLLHGWRNVKNETFSNFRGDLRTCGAQYIKRPYVVLLLIFFYILRKIIMPSTNMLWMHG